MEDRLLGQRYRLVRQLGEGGMGQVWEARDEALGRLVAVKVIASLTGGGDRGDEARARFLREARITAALQHPHVVTVHDLGETETGGGSAPFLVMELLRGETLDAVVRRGPVALPDAARWGAQVSDALAEAHDNGILHRDIKPSNILVTRVGTVKVLDFGIARAADPSRTANHLTRTGFIVGTPPYMAPEQARGHPEARSDLYALGCVLFELITGRPPFRAPDAVGYLTAHLTEEPPAPGSVDGRVPPDWDEAVLTLLRKNPDQRYASAAELARVLRRLATGPGTPAPLRTEKAGRQPVTRAVTPAATRVLPEGNPPFSMSWTGEEPRSGYAARPGVLRSGLKAAGLALLAAASICFPLLTGRITRGPGSSDNPWMLLPSAGIVLALLAGVVVMQGIRETLRRKEREQWALHVGPAGVATTTGAAGRNEFAWDRIQRVVIEEIQCWPPYRYTGVHLDLVPGAVRPAVARPAGWVYPESDTLMTRQNGRIPVCVLGPMTEQQRADLVRAFARYGGPRWESSVSFTTPPVKK
ncbi:serine/threonine-protein kinase [Streptomyces sp. NPDC057689]|uniref:serine/threonine-protein kinase n=1 Tax=Streptomyces sp. NPDC057689 TaxID=3346213 RepID=UPI0036B86092